MHKWHSRLAVLLLVAVMALGAGSLAVGQNPNGDVVCDSDLVTLWFVAERFFGFGAVHNTVLQTSANPGGELDLNRINPGQFSTLFAGLQGVRDPNTMAPPQMSFTQDWLSLMASVIQLDDTTFRDFVTSMQPAGTDISAFLPLAPVAVPNEAPECTRLRAQLQRFFAAISFQDMQSGFTTPFGNTSNANFNTNTNDNTGGAGTNDNGAGANTNANMNTNDNTGGGGSTDANSNANANTNDNSGDGNDNDDDDDDDDDDNSGPGGGGGDDDDDDDDDDNSGQG